MLIISNRLFSVIDLFPHGVKEPASFLFADIADQGRFADDILAMLKSVFREGGIFCDDIIQDGMIQVYYPGVVEDRAERIVSQDKFIDE